MAGREGALAGTYLDVTASPIKREMQVLDLAVLAEFVVDDLLIGLLVDVCDDDDPALDGAGCRGAAVCLHGVVATRGGSGASLLRLVNFHLDFGHGDGMCLSFSRE